MEQAPPVAHADDRRMLERLLAAFEHLSESIVLTDPQDRFVIANRAFREINRNVAHAIQPGQKFEDYLRAGLAAGNYPDAAGREQEWLEARLAERRNPSGPVERQRSGGRWFKIEDRQLPDGSTIRFGTEITERKRAEAALNAEMRAALKELDAFTYSVSHDLRAPIGAVSGFAHLLRSAEAERLSADGLRLLGFIEHNAERMARLIEGLLRFSRLGRSDLHRTRVSMNGLAAESLLDFVDEAARARIAAGSMPECNGDPALLSQVWSNLIGNALKYSRGADAPCIDIGWDAARNAYFVRDNGAGFDMAYAGKLFGVFERLHAESEFEGSGIGLAIAERIIRLHGGAIWADAAPGQGATFWFTVPALVNGAPPEARSWEN